MNAAAGAEAGAVIQEPEALPEGVGVIFIGRNEALRLGRVLGRVAPVRGRVVYVDSGSTDDSAGIAERAGVHVVRLTEGPFTAARGRVAGLEFLARETAGVDLVQFVDGDCVLTPGWLERAAAFMRANADAGSVTGRLREEHPERSLFVRLVDADWADLPIGRIDAVGGNSMIRRSALESVGGWRTDLVAGEELDLSTRMIGAGFTLHRLDTEMCRHDIGIGTFGEYWRRSIRTGHAWAQLAWIHGFSGPRRWITRTLGAVAYGLVLPMVLALGAVLYWPLAVVVAAVYALLWVRIALWRVRRGDPLGGAAVYGLVVSVCKVAVGWGVVLFARSLLTRRATPLFDYKCGARQRPPAAQNSGAPAPSGVRT